MMPIVTIRGQLGSGAPEIGRQVADRLHIDYIDREVIATVAVLLNERKQDVLAKEMPAGSLLDRIAQALGANYAVGGFYGLEGGLLSSYSGAYLPAWQIPLDDTRYLSGLESVIKELARNRSAVIRGRGSQFILKDHPETLHVLIVTPLETRVIRLMQSTRMDKESAQKEVARSDDSRREFIKRYFKAEMGDPVHYDIVINSGNFGFEHAASIIVNAIPFLDRREGRQSQIG
jgi:CMP/dCMP kinase